MLPLSAYCIVHNTPYNALYCPLNIPLQTSILNNSLGPHNYPVFPGGGGGVPGDEEVMFPPPWPEVKKDSDEIFPRISR